MRMKTFRKILWSSYHSNSLSISTKRLSYQIYCSWCQTEFLHKIWLPLHAGPIHNRIISNGNIQIYFQFTPINSSQQTLASFWQWLDKRLLSLNVMMWRYLIHMFFLVSAINMNTSDPLDRVCVHAVYLCIIKRTNKECCIKSNPCICINQTIK